jgi:hypothetical protein
VTIEPSPSASACYQLSESEQELLRVQRAMEKSAAISATEKVSKLASAGLSDRKVRELIALASRTPRQGKRIRLILEAASTWAQPFAAESPCRRGCASCCHLPVVITSAEARALATATGRPMHAPADALTVREFTEGADAARLRDGVQHAGVPCPFLVDSACSVYESRPTVCRTHLSLAPSALLCQVVPGHPVNVPYADATRIRAYGLMLMIEDVMADIREFFPV